jgi:lipoate-protein ligase A
VWRRIGPAVLAGPDAVARPLALLAAMTPGAAPVASWSATAGPALVLGRAAHDPPLSPAAGEPGVHVVRRRSGGGPVLWDAGLLGLDVVLPPGHPLADRDVALAYRWLGEAVAEAIRDLGVGARSVPVREARAAQRRDDPRAALAARACFGGLSPYEVVGPDGRKVVGLSQVRRRTGALFQCGVALDLDMRALAALLEGDTRGRDALAAALGGAAAGLRAWAPGLTAGEVVAAVERALGRRLGVRLRQSSLTGAERDAARRAMLTG